jgi:hypothetical protein
MHAAPPATVRATGGAVWRSLQALLPALASATFLGWLLHRMELDPAPALALALPVGLVAWWRARAEPVALAWDGQRWTADGAVASLQLMIDLGPWMLLRTRAETDRVRWIACTAVEAGAAWHAFRSAVYSRPSEASPRVRPPGRAAD